MSLLKRGKNFLKREGLIPFIRHSFSFFFRSLFNYQTYYLYEKTLDLTNEFEFLPKIQSLILKVISTKDELNNLIAEGFEISSYADIQRWLDKGTVAFFIFVGKNFAHVTWVAFNEKAKEEIDVLPYAVGFNKNEVCSGASLTKPDYRGKGLLIYVYSKIFPFLRKRGIVIDRFSINTKNVASQRAHSKFSPKIYAKGYHLKFLSWKFWKEKPLKDDLAASYYIAGLAKGIQKRDS